MILSRYLLTSLLLYLKFSDHVIQAYDWTFKGSTAPMVDMGTYEFKDLNTETITPEESFIMLTQKKYLNRNKNILILNDHM